jgi:hypothetical protein
MTAREPVSEAPSRGETLTYLACAAVAAGLLATMVGPDTPHARDFMRALPWLAPALAALSLIAPPVPERLRGWTCVGIAALSVTTSGAILLRHTHLSLGGDSQDAGFIIQQLVKAKLYVVPRDGTYAVFAPFYPPLYTQVLGKLAALGSLEASTTWKPAALVMSACVPGIAYAWWARLVGRSSAAAVVSLGAFALPVLHLHKTHEWLSLILFLPWWLLYVAPGAAANASASDPRTRWTGAFFGALLALTFYYWFLVGVLAFAIEALRGNRRTPREGLAGFPVLCGVVAVASIYWLPLAYQAITIDFTPLQQRWFRPAMNRFPLRLSLDPNDLLWLAGLGCALFLPRLASRKGDERVARVLRSLATWALACLAWFVLGRLAVALDRPILHVKALPLLRHALEAAFVIGVITALGTWFGRAWRQAAAVALVALALMTNLRAYAATEGSDLYAKARPKRASETRFRARTGGLDLRDKVVLAADVRPLQYSAAFSFLGLSAHYAHPSARFTDRYSFLRELVRLDDAREVCTLLRHNRHAPVDYLWWERGERLQVYLDGFPKGIRAGHFAWTGSGKHGDCLPPVAPRGPLHAWQRVIDPITTKNEPLSPRARALAMHHGDEVVRRRADATR